MVKLTKYAKILICRDRSNGSTIKELCISYGLERKTIVIILQRTLILLVDNGQLPTGSNKKRILHKKDVLRSNPDFERSLMSVFLIECGILQKIS